MVIIVFYKKEMDPCAFHMHLFDTFLLFRCGDSPVKGSTVNLESDMGSFPQNNSLRFLLFVHFVVRYA